MALRLPMTRSSAIDSPAMAIHPDLLEILACPVCKTPVEVVKDGAGLRCGQCKRV
ncbi:MAG TPA: Trm112 family protein, partial [Vicinamibacteria bacterium]|nr:Trm112 family protein [Vicinamibacteria bacterium]